MASYRLSHGARSVCHEGYGLTSWQCLVSSSRPHNDPCGRRLCQVPERLDRLRMSSFLQRLAARSSLDVPRHQPERAKSEVDSDSDAHDASPGARRKVPSPSELSTADAEGHEVMRLASPVGSSCLASDGGGSHEALAACGLR